MSAIAPPTSSSTQRDTQLLQQPDMFTTLKRKLTRKSAPPPSSRPGVQQTSKISPTTPKQMATSSEKPPTYSETITPTPNPGASSSSSSSSSSSEDSPYAFLTTFTTIFLIDDSGSMAGPRWQETAAALETITPICTAHSPDGIALHFLNHPDAPAHHHLTTPAAIRALFATVRPGGPTPTGQRLAALLTPYLRRYAAAPATTKPLNVICVTDGVPTDDVESALVAAARTLDRLDAPAWQLGVQFFQVGADADAAGHLRLLDDELAALAGGAPLRDIVDTVPFQGRGGTRLTADGVLKVVLGAVNRRLDRKGSADLYG